MRLDKFLVDCGVGSRSQVKTFLKKKQVTVNGQVETSPKTQIDEKQDQIAFQGQADNTRDLCLLSLNKPQCSFQQQRMPVTRQCIRFIDDTARHKQVFPVGRLDIDTHGLLH